MAWIMTELRNVKKLLDIIANCSQLFEFLFSRISVYDVYILDYN